MWIWAGYIFPSCIQVFSRSCFSHICDIQDACSVLEQMITRTVSLQWRHNERDSVSHHQPHDCLLNRLFRRRSKKTSKLRVPGLCAANSPGTGEFPAQMASYAENVSIWWRHHVTRYLYKNDNRWDYYTIVVSDNRNKASLHLWKWIGWMGSLMS